MPLTPPCIAAPLRPDIAAGLAALTERSRSRLSDDDKKFGARLLADAYCDILDHVCFDLLRTIEKSHPSPHVHEALAAGDEIKSRIHSSLNWVVGFFSSERIIPVIHYFNGLTHSRDQGGEVRHFTIVPLAPALAAASRRSLDDIAAGRVANLDEGVELLIQVVEVCVEAVVHQPQRLMKFNFVVNKTLDGVIALVLSLFKRMLRKMGAQVSREVYPEIANHLSRFLVVSAP